MEAAEIDGRVVRTCGDAAIVQHDLHLPLHRVDEETRRLAEIHALLQVVDHVQKVATWCGGQRRLVAQEELGVDAAVLEHLLADRRVFGVHDKGGEAIRDRVHLEYVEDVRRRVDRQLPKHLRRH